jgi:hypothetical protein
MPRTTLDIDAPILRDLKRLQREERKSLGRLVSDLLASALGARRQTRAPTFKWLSKPMGEARVDLRDKDALWRVLDQR